MAGLMSRTSTDHQGEVLEAARPRREPDRDARLFVRAAVAAAPERQARHRGRRHVEEAARDADSSSSRAGQARDAGAPGAGGGPRGSRAAGARAQGRSPGRSSRISTRRSSSSRSSSRSSSPREKQLQSKIESFRSQKEVIKAQYSAAEAQVRIGEAATGIGEQMADTGLAIQRAKDKTAGDAGARVCDRRADGVGRAGRLHLRPTSARPRARADLAAGQVDRELES